MMTIQHYLDTIHNRNLENDSIKDFDSVHLEYLISKISLDGKSHFTLKTLFQKASDNEIVINTETVMTISKSLNLLFSDEIENGNVCYAESNELRLEYKLSFKLIDLLDYINAFERSSIYKETQKIIMPSDPDLFWNLVKIGKSIREIEK
ncbi:hypothetical protein GJU42_05165 [Flavobacterium resistens]|nr:hypothetical protein [Flavobacterium resistens]MRX67348.1 hypothetical protein [Flavobacterium resistens]